MPTALTRGRTTRRRSSCRRGWDIAPRTLDTSSSSKLQRGRLGAGKRPGNRKKQSVSRHETMNSPHSQAPNEKWHLRASHRWEPTLGEAQNCYNNMRKRSFKFLRWGPPLSGVRAWKVT